MAISRGILIFVAVVGAMEAPRVAIVGSGIGGSSASVYLRRKLGHSSKIDVYEKDGHTCGRLGLIRVAGNEYNSGGCVIHPRNM
eukprot:1342517-Amorphochlora_amoeboformis.AAC.1